MSERRAEAMIKARALLKKCIILIFNAQNYTRVSIDFRSVTITDFMRYSQSGIHRITRPNPMRKAMELAIGEDAYYLVVNLREKELGDEENYEKQRAELDALLQLEDRRKQTAA